MGKLNQLTVLQSETPLDYVPLWVEISGVPTTIAWRNQLGAVSIEKAGYTSPSRETIAIEVTGGNRYKCHAATFGDEGFSELFVEAIKNAVESGVKVELCVALNPKTGRGARDFFCGFRLAGSSTGDTLISL